VPNPDRKREGLRGLKALAPYLSLLRGQEPALAGAVVLMLISTAVSLAIPLYAGKLVGYLGTPGSALLAGAPWPLLAGLLGVQLVGSFLFQVLSARVGLETAARLRRRVFSHLLELPALFFSGQKAGDLSSRVTSDVGSIQYMLTSGFISFARAVLTLIGALVLMLNMNARLTAMVLLLIPTTILLVRLFGSRLQKLSRVMYDELGRINSHVQETVGGIRSLKVYNAQVHESGRFAGLVGAYQDAGMRRAWISAALESGIQISLWICLLGIVVYGFTLTARGEASQEELVAFLLLAFRVAVPMSSLTRLFAQAQGAAAAADRLEDIFALAPERRPGSPVPPTCHDPVRLTMTDLTFSYDSAGETPPVIDGLTLDIPAGHWVGIVGPSGAGKTTLANILLGLFPPTSGSLELNGRPYADYDLSELRAHMAWVSQEPMLYDLSLTDNIRFGLPDVSSEEIIAAAARARVMEFADKMPAGLDTPCGERGARLSGGQKQRVALARAFLRNPGLLVLDEPTSALDAESEDSIRHAMSELMENRTAIVIAHRLSLVRDLDLILVISDGRVIQTGSHKELMKHPGLYRTLFDLQQGDDINSQNQR